MLFNIDLLLRENIRNLMANSVVATEINTEGKILLNTNENSLGSPLKKWYNRYTNTYQQKLEKAISFVKNISTENIFLDNGSVECIDGLIRSFCEPQKDNIVIFPPTIDIYKRTAQINNVEVREVTLLDNFQVDLIHLENKVDAHTKIIFICSPNNPTANSINRTDIEFILNNFDGLVVVDEAYINFSKQKSFMQQLTDYPNLIVLQTFSKAWGLAGLRLAMAFASAEIMAVLKIINPQYSINQITQDVAYEALQEIGQVNDMIKILVDMRETLKEVFKQMPIVQKVYESDANFLLVKFNDAKKVNDFLLSKNILVKDCNNQPLCENCLRITIGTEKENTVLVDALIEYMSLHES